MSYGSYPISAIFSDIYLCKMEYDVVVPAKSLFYNFYNVMLMTQMHRKKNINELIQNLNSYHKNIKLTLDENPKKLPRLLERIIPFQLRFLLS